MRLRLPLPASSESNRFAWLPFSFLLACMPVLFRSDLKVFDDVDEQLFHHPTIQRFASQLPWPDLSDYPSATTPLYHLLMAPISWMSGDDLTVLRLSNLVVSALTVWLMVRTLSSWGRFRTAWPCALAVAVSPYFVGPAVRLSTDNLALLGIVATLAATHPSQQKSAWTSAGWASMTIATRQIHAWLMLPLAIAAFNVPAKRSTWLLISALPLALLAFFMLTWGALTPPSFAKGHTAAINLDVFLFILGILGTYGLFFSPWLLPALRQRYCKQWVPGIIALTFALLSVHQMPWTDDPNRWGGAIWTASKNAPLLLDIPLTFWVTAPIGALTLLAFAFHPRKKHGHFLFIVSAAWLVANLVSARAYQKYYDPMSLFLLGAFIQGHTETPKWKWIGPILLITGLLFVTIKRFYL
jgi:hypothetical protein